MATITQNQDQTLTVTLTDIEVQTVAMIQDDALAQYVTLWLEERAKTVFNERFKQLSPTDQLAVLAKFAGQG